MPFNKLLGVDTLGNKNYKTLIHSTFNSLDDYLTVR